jgi:hypothetical protein
MRVFIQQFDNGKDRYFINVPIQTEKEGNKAFKKMYINFFGCEPTIGNITPREIWLSGYKFVQERTLQDKITGNQSTVDVKSTEITLNIKNYEKTEADIEMDAKDNEAGKKYIKPPYNAEQIAQNKLNAYNKRKSQQQEQPQSEDYISIPQEDLGEMLPF